MGKADAVLDKRNWSSGHELCIFAEENKSIRYEGTFQPHVVLNNAFNCVS
jgi:hypothetical protein